MSADWAAKKGFTFPLLSDPELNVIDAYHMRNEDVEDLALHGVFIVDQELRVTYRKIARRRVGPDELLHALDGDPVKCCAGSCGDGPICVPIDDGASVPVSSL